MNNAPKRGGKGSHFWRDGIVVMSGDGAKGREGATALDETRRVR